MEDYNCEGTSSTGRWRVESEEKNNWATTVKKEFSLKNNFYSVFFTNLLPPQQPIPGVTPTTLVNLRMGQELRGTEKDKVVVRAVVNRIDNYLSTSLINKLYRTAPRRLAEGTGTAVHTSLRKRERKPLWMKPSIRLKRKCGGTMRRRWKQQRATLVGTRGQINDCLYSGEFQKRSPVVLACVEVYVVRHMERKEGKCQGPAQVAPIR